MKCLTTRNNSVSEGDSYLAVCYGTGNFISIYLASESFSESAQSIQRLLTVFNIHLNIIPHLSKRLRNSLFSSGFSY